MDNFQFFAPLLQAGAQQDGSGQMTMSFVMLGLIFVIFYFFMIRPQSKRQKETKKMLDALKKGDKVVSIGGIRGIVQSVKEDTVLVKVDDNTKIEFSKSAISGVVDQKTEESSKKETVQEK